VTPSRIAIVPVEPFADTGLLGSLCRTLSGVFDAEVGVAGGYVDPDRAFDPTRNQYNSSSILLQLIERPPPDADRILGVTHFDLFVPILTFLFGEAQYRGPGAVVSTARLKNEFYGMPPDPILLQERLLKESVHELGHTFGLKHCYSPGCVMVSSTDIEGIDAKSPLFCERCRASLRKES